MNSPPTVSVVMSVFNGQAFLSEAIESILGQALREFEFLIIDDGSTDRTAEILAGYASRDARIRVLRHENKGRAESLNIGIEQAAGKYIARMDADDVAMPYRLAEQIEFMERHPEVGLLGGAVNLISAAGRVVKTAQPPLEDTEIRSLMLRYNPMFHPTVVMRKEVALAAGGYRKALLDADDYDLWLRMSLSDVEEITPQLLETLGVTAAETQEALRGAYGYWTEILKQIDSQAALHPVRHAFRARLWHPLLNFTRPIRHALGLRKKSLKAIFVWFENLYWSVHPGPRPLVFDVGANAGAKTEQYLRNGAKVVCFEPQSACVDALRERFRGNDRVVVVPTALGAHIGEAEMSICTQENTISTFADAWKTGRFKDKIWDRAEVVAVTTLDAAIDRHGMPFYCKIDVEGFEHTVFSGLTRQIPVLSFEFCAEGLDQTQACLDLLSRLGYASFNACLGEARVYVLRAAVSSVELMNQLRSMSDPLAWGDVYAAVGSRIPDSRLLPGLLHR